MSWNHSYHNIIYIVKHTAHQILTDRELVKLLIEKDDHFAFMEIYNRYTKKLYYTGRKKIDKQDDIKDLIQEVFMAVWQNRHALSVDTPLGGYLFATMRYIIIKRIAHKKVQKTYLDSLDPDTLLYHTSSTDTLTRENELKKMIETEISSLPEKMQKVFRMSREDHLSHKEIASELGLSEATVKKHVNNALKSLRLRLGSLLFLIWCLSNFLF